MTDTKSDKLKQQAIALNVCSMYILANESVKYSIADKFIHLADHQGKIELFLQDSGFYTIESLFAEWLENMLDEALEGGND